MNKYYKTDEWSVVETGFNPEMQRASESIFSLGNGAMGQRASFEEKYSGDSFQGTYMAGVYYPDKTRVGWWKVGYPEYFAKVLNAPNWIGINVEIDGEDLDLNNCNVTAFQRELNMRHAYLDRSFTAEMENGKTVKVSARRFLSMADDEIGAIRYSVRVQDFKGILSFLPYIDGDVHNEDANFDEQFWQVDETVSEEGSAFLLARTFKSEFLAGMSMHYSVEKNGKAVEAETEVIKTHKFTGNVIRIPVEEGDEVVIYKYVSVLNSMNYEKEDIMRLAGGKSLAAMEKGFDQLFEEHARQWERKWAISDIIIEGDSQAQQGIRFNIFHLNQTYTGRDERLNIGPKGFTGEKYGGTTYWDTEAYLIPFYLSTAPEEVARNLLKYRYKHLPKAIENAAKLGFSGGAALYPMVTINGEESHNEWEITFEEIHRNGAIAHAIYNYIRYTGDDEYLAEYGLEVLIALSRFWRQRVNWSDVKGKYVILGVTGPNEYENNVNNNWYTNYVAVWTLKYTMQSLEHVMENYPEHYSRVVEQTSFHFEKETLAWKDIVEYMYFPYYENLGVFLQQDDYLDKEQRKTDDLDPADRPLNQNWSWDRILRSCFLKQGDVLQGMFFFEEEFDTDTLRRNYDFYEPRTVHESSLSPSLHAVIACRLGYLDKAYELYLRTSRLDLDDYNQEVHEGLHITSMGGTWMSVVYGFAGLRVKDHCLHLNPKVPSNWKSLSFKVFFRGNVLKINIQNSHVSVRNEEGDKLEIYIHGRKTMVGRDEMVEEGF